MAGGRSWALRGRSQRQPAPLGKPAVGTVLARRQKRLRRLAINGRPSDAVSDGSERRSKRGLLQTGWVNVNLPPDWEEEVCLKSDGVGKAAVAYGGAARHQVGRLRRVGEAG
jgi:hypothetical protein